MDFFLAGFAKIAVLIPAGAREAAAEVVANKTWRKKVLKDKFNKYVKDEAYALETLPEHLLDDAGRRQTDLGPDSFTEPDT